MVTPLRSRPYCFAASVLALGFLVAGCDPTIKLTPTPATIPGVSIGPVTSATASTTATIDVESVEGFSGFVDLSASCCRNVIRDIWEPAGAGHVVVNFATNPVNVPGNGSASSLATISMTPLNSGPYAYLGPNIPFGKHLISVLGKSQDGKASATTDVGVTVLPAGEPAPGCKPGVEVIPLTSGGFTMGAGTPAPTGVLQLQIAAAEANPRAKSTSMVIYRATGTEGPVGAEAFKMTITDDSGLSPGTAVIVLKHMSTKNEDKEVSTVGCSSAGKSIVATKATPTSVQMMLQRTQDRTLYLREKSVCTNFLCTSTTWADSIVFPEVAFWSVFGGKRVTFEWHECTTVLKWCI